MDYAIAVCTLREETLSLRDRLNRMGVFAHVVSTPRMLRLGCGLSVKFALNDLASVRRCVRYCPSFKGYYLYTQQGYEKIY